MEALRFNFSVDGTGTIEYVDGEIHWFAIFYKGVYYKSANSIDVANAVINNIIHEKDIAEFKNFLNELQIEDLISIARPLSLFVLSLENSNIIYNNGMHIDNREDPAPAP